MSKMLERLLKKGAAKNSFMLSESPSFQDQDVIPTSLPILNAALSGSIQGGITPGVTILAGPSQCFKSMLGLYAMKAYLDKYPDAGALYYDTERGINPGYVEAFDLDMNRIGHIIPTHIEEMRFDIHQKLKDVQPGEKVFVFIDSLSNAVSNKDIQDAENENLAKNMQRQQGIRDLLRVMSSHLYSKGLPAFCVNHTYQTQEIYSKTVVSGGTAVMYIANQVFIITKSVAKEGDEVVGNDFNIRVEKSRSINVPSKFSFRVIRGKGIQRYSGLFDLAMEAEIVKEVTKGWYSAPGYEKARKKEIENDSALWEALIEDNSFDDFIKKKYQLSMGSQEHDDV